MSTALIAPTYAEITRAYKHFVLLNGSPAALAFLLDPAVTGGSLETWLGTPDNLAQFEQLIAAPSGAAALCASGTAMAAVAASSTAMAAVAASSTAMAAVAASSTAMAAVFDSLTAKAAIWASDVAVGAISNSTPAYDWLVANKAVKSAATVVAQTPGKGFDTGKSLLLDVEMNANNTSYGVKFTTKQGTVGDAEGPDSIGHRYTTTRFKNVMAATDLTCLDGNGGDPAYTVTLRYVVMD